MGESGYNKWKGIVLILAANANKTEAKLMVLLGKLTARESLFVWIFRSCDAVVRDRGRAVRQHPIF